MEGRRYCLTSQPRAIAAPRHFRRRANPQCPLSQTSFSIVIPSDPTFVGLVTLKGARPKNRRDKSNRLVPEYLMSSPDPPAFPAPSPKPVWKRLLKAFAITTASVVVLLIVFAIVLANWPDSKEFDDSAMIPVWDPALGDNPLARYQDWLEENVDPEEKDPRWQMAKKDAEWDPEEADRFLEENRELLDRFHALAAASDEPWQWREMDAMAHFTHQLPYVKSLIDAGKAVLIQGRLALENDDVETAVKAAESLLRVGVGIKKARGSMIHHLVGSGLFRKGIESLEANAKTNANPLAPRHSQSLAETLTKIDANSADPSFALRAEYLTFKHGIDDLLAGNVPKDLNDFETRILVASTPFLQRNNSLKLYFELIKPIFDSQGRRDDWSEVKSAVKRQSECTIKLKSNRIRLIADPNAIGKILVSLAVPAFQVLIERDFEDRALIRATQLLLAIKRFEQQHGAPPAKLEELVPDFLPAIPSDPFSGAPILWAPATGAIYSVGPDENDDGGKFDEKSRNKPRDVGVRYQKT